MSSRKKSSTKVGGKKASPTGQRQFSNLLRSQTALMKDTPKSRVANVGRTIQTVNRKPIQTMLSNGNTLIRHREFIAKVPGSVNFSVTSVPINPGLPAQFQWLYPVANQYESYQFRKLSYHFVNSKTGTFSGDVIMGIDYDPSDPVPFNENELQNYWGCKTGVLTEPLNLMANLPALNKIPNKFCRIGATSANQDIKLYDSGNFFIATADCADSSTIGRLFVEYEVELKTPQVNGSNILSGKNLVATASQAAPLGTGQGDIVTTGTLPIVWLSGTTFSIPVPGQYLLISVIAGTGITAQNITAASPSLITSLDSTGTSTLWSNDYAIKVNSSSDIFTIVSTATTVSSFNMRLAPYIYSIV